MPTTPDLSTLAPAYDRSAITTGIVHIGVGGFHRAHQAMYIDRLMREGLGSGAPDSTGSGAPDSTGSGAPDSTGSGAPSTCLDWGICGVGLLPGDARMRDALASQDHTYTLTLKHSDGHHESTVIGSIHDYLFAPDDPQAVLRFMAEPATRIVSLTVTEGGYNIDDATGAFRTESDGARHDAAHPHEPSSAFGYIVEALRRRR